MLLCVQCKEIQHLDSTLNIAKRKVKQEINKSETGLLKNLTKQEALTCDNCGTNKVKPSVNMLSHAAGQV